MLAGPPEPDGRFWITGDPALASDCSVDRGVSVWGWSCGSRNWMWSKTDLERFWGCRTGDLRTCTQDLGAWTASGKDLLEEVRASEFSVNQFSNQYLRAIFIEPITFWNICSWVNLFLLNMQVLFVLNLLVRYIDLWLYLPFFRESVVREGQIALRYIYFLRRKVCVNQLLTWCVERENKYIFFLWPTSSSQTCFMYPL